MPNPYVILGAVLIAISVYFYGHHKGWVERDFEMQAEIAKKNEESRAKEQEMSTKLNEQSSKLQEANNAIDQKQSALDRAIRAGRVRLPSSSCVQTTANPTPTSGNSNQAGSQPNGQTDTASDTERETIRLIAQITADGDRAINQLNACIDSYNEMRKIANGQR